MAMLDQSLGQLARTIPGATQVFDSYKLDFCCGGKHSLREAAREKGVDAEAVAADLRLLQQGATPAARDWRDAPAAELTAHIVRRFHEAHRKQLPELIRLAQKVEQVHGDRPECPTGLADYLATMRQELESHMQKEEQILFPLLATGAGGMASGPIAVMRMEHEEHGRALQRLSGLTNDLNLPDGACNTWHALYAGLKAFRDDLVQHIHLENNVLFENAVAPAPAAA